MSRHNHKNCKTPNPEYYTCTKGRLTDYCDSEGDGSWVCGNEYCVDRGHCDCKCHSGKVCNCGHVWPKE